MWDSLLAVHVFINSISRRRLNNSLLNLRFPSQGIHLHYIVTVQDRTVDTDT